jgi:hypothetical protein
MNTKIDNPANCEVQSAIRFLNAENVLLVEFMPRGATINAESLCNSEEVMVRHSKPTAGHIVKRRDAPAQQCTPACCCQNASNASRVWLGSF